MDIAGILSDTQLVLAFMGPHWPFFLYTFLFAFVGEVSKRQVFTPENKLAMKVQANKFWNHSTLGKAWACVILAFVRVPFEFHPMIAGIVLGNIPGVPVSAGVTYGILSSLYCMSAGVLSLGRFAFGNGLIKFWWRVILRRTDDVPFQLPGTPV